MPDYSIRTSPIMHEWFYQLPTCKIWRLFTFFAWINYFYWPVSMPMPFRPYIRGRYLYLHKRCSSGFIMKCRWWWFYPQFACLLLCFTKLETRKNEKTWNIHKFRIDSDTLTAFNLRFGWSCWTSLFYIYYGFWMWWGDTLNLL